jgi:hypothetical protein
MTNPVSNFPPMTTPSPGILDFSQQSITPTSVKQEPTMSMKQEPTIPLWSIVDSIPTPPDFKSGSIPTLPDFKSTPIGTFSPSPPELETVPTSPTLPNLPQQENELTSDGQQTYEIEKLVDRRKIGRGYQYSVKWKGYPDTDNQWRARTDLHPDLIEEFYPSVESNIEVDDSIIATSEPNQEVSPIVNNDELPVVVNNDELPADEAKSPDQLRRSSRHHAATQRLDSIDAHFTSLVRNEFSKLSSRSDSSDSSDDNSSDQVVLFTVPIVKDKNGSWTYNGVNVADISTPRSFKKAKSGNFVDEWEGAMDDEFNELDSKGTWIPIRSLDDDRVIGSVWVFKLKLDEFNSTLRFKARLCVQGSGRIPGVDHTADEVFASVVKLKTIRTLISYALQQPHPELIEMEHWDIKNAFVASDMPKRVLMHQPQGYYLHSGKVLKLLKSLYGLPESMRLFEDLLKAHLVSMGFKTMKSDPMLYELREGDDFIIIPAYVDDLLPLHNSKRLKKKVFDSLKKRFDITNLGHLKYSLGVHFDLNFVKGEAKMKMSKHKRELVVSVGMENSSFTPTPLSNVLERPLTPISDQEQRAVAQILGTIDYKSAVGSIGYLAQAMCPDLAYTHSTLARFLTGVTVEAAKALKRTLRYIAGTVDLELIYRRQTCGNRSKAVFFTDSSFADDFNDAKSQSGMLCFTFGNLTNWKSARQPCVSTSTFHAETQAAHLAATELMWVRFLLLELRTAEDEPSIFWQDNAAVIRNTRNPTKHEASKHINVKFLYKRELCEQGFLNMLPIPTRRQLADALTKPLDAANFLRLRAGYMGAEYWPETGGLDPPATSMFADLHQGRVRQAPLYWTQALQRTNSFTRL